MKIVIQREEKIDDTKNRFLTKHLTKNKNKNEKFRQNIFTNQNL